MGENGSKNFKTEFANECKYINKKLAYPYENFKSIDDYQKPVDNLQKDFFSKLKNDYLSDEEIQRTKEIIK